MTNFATTGHLTVERRGDLFGITDQDGIVRASFLSRTGVTDKLIIMGVARPVAEATVAATL